MSFMFSQEDFRKTTIKTVTGDAVPVGTIFCIGRNYRQHIKELNSQDVGDPLIFIKPATAICQGLPSIPLPRQSTEIHHEVELVVYIGKKGKDIPPQEAAAYIAGAAIALDLTLRDFQNNAKKNGTPWTIAKGFDYSCPISPIYPERDLDSLAHVELILEKNGMLVQQGNTADMIFPIDFLISYISRFFTLQPGDLILTGTPAGVGPILPEDTLTFTASFSQPVTLKFT